MTILGGGTVTVRASQSGSNDYLEAAPVDRSFTVARAAQNITFGSLTDKVYGDAPVQLIPTATSGLPVSLTVVSGSAAAIDSGP